MRLKCTLTLVIVGVVFSLNLGSTGLGQVVINEIVYDSSPNATRFAEFVELYNAGDSAVDLSDWALTSRLLGDNSLFFTDMIPSGASIAPGSYYVLGNALTVANVDLDLGDGTDLWPNQNVGGDSSAILELRDSSENLVDAFAYERNKGSAGITTEQTDQVAGGWWGNVQNYDRPDFMISIGRYLDGRDTNNNGRDFGVLPMTPGEPNNLPQNPTYSLPDVDSLTPLDPVPGFSGSFVQARAVDLSVADAVNPNAIAASPQGGNAIIAWDDAGGGNMDFSEELVTDFDIYTYLDTAFYGTPGTADVPGAESTTYGIGTTGTLHNTPDPTSLLFGETDPDTGEPIITANGNTGIGWVFQKEDSASLNRLMLVDFNDGGTSNPIGGDWTVIESIEMAEMESGWHRLSIEFDPDTGDVVAMFDDQVFEFTTSTDLIGTFYIGYRESLAADNNNLLRPPTFDLFVESAAGLIGDYNNDGEVDAADYTVWRDNVGAETLPFNRDPDIVGAVGEEDYDAWVANFGMTIGSGSSAAVPEMSSLAQTVMAFLVLAAFSWRRCRS